MKSMLALIQREYLEHRGAFLYAPLVILALLAVIMFAALGLNRVPMPFEIGVPSLLTFFEIGFFGMAGLWFAYLLIALFFYYADAFSADRRNNSMFFWKSMPVSDFKVLSSKMLAGMTIFPALVFVALILTVVLLYAVIAVGSLTMPQFIVPSIVDVLAATWQIGIFALVYLMLGLLWYAPFFAWVGALSTIFRRWSIPLAFLIPGLAALAEKLIIGRDGFRPGQILGYLRDRMAFGMSRQQMQEVFLADPQLDAGRLLQGLFASIDWPQLAGGLIVATLLVFVASEYRRRVITT